MAGEGKCPKCGKNVTKLKISSTTSSIDGQSRAFPTVMFCCPSCSSVLGVQIDPVAVMSGTVKGITRALKGGGAPKGGGAKS